MSDAPTPAAGPPRRSPWTRLAGWPAAVVLLAVHATLAFSATLGKTAAWDEVSYVAGAVAAWSAHRYDVECMGGQIPQRVAGLPLAIDGLALPRTMADAPQIDPYAAAQAVLFGEPGRAERVLPRARAAMTILSVLLGAIVYLWSRRLFGRGGALVSLGLFAFCPNFLAHGPLVTSDVAGALFFLAACGASWRLLHRLSIGNLLLAGLAIGGLCLSKMSAVLVLPMVVVLVAIRLAVGRPLLVALPGIRRVVRTRGLEAAWVGAAAAVVVLAVWTCIWAVYGFRFVARVPATSFPWEMVAGQGSFASRGITWARELRLLPEGWLIGLAETITATGERSAFLNGEVRLSGWPWFFPYALLVKTPVATLATLAAAACAGAAGLRRTSGAAQRRWRWRGLYRTAPLWVLLAVYGSVAVASHLNIGLRHVLPVSAGAFVLAGAAGRWLARTRRPALRWAAAAVLLALPLESLAVYPNYLAFFNVLVGGPRHGYEHLVDSSLDWGQDLPALKRWLDAHGLQRQDRIPVYVSYFGNGNVRYYGIEATVLLGFGIPPQEDPGAPPLRPGVYCMSVTLLQGVYWLEAIGRFWSAEREQEYQAASWALARLRAEGRESDFDLPGFVSLRMARLSHYLRGKEPQARINHTIFVYALGDEDLAAFDGAWPGGVPPPTARSSDRDRASADHR